jgi:lipoate-protein ligase A
MTLMQDDTVTNSSGSEHTGEWRVLHSDASPMGRQLALGEAMLAGLAERPEPTVRWYVTQNQALLLGNGQRPDVADLTACRARGVAVYRRTTGGSAVLVDGDAVSMEVALPAGHPLASGDVVRAYQWIGEVWAEALRSVGIASARTIPTEEVRALPALAKEGVMRLACYGTLSPFEVVVGTRKVVGLCQVRRRPGTIYQVDTHLRWRPERLASLLAISESQRRELAAQLRNVAAGLDELAGREVSADEVIAAAEAALVQRVGARLVPGEWRADEHDAVERIELDRFQRIG